MLLSAVSVLVVEQSSSEVPEGLMNNPVYSQFMMHGQKNIKLPLCNYTVTIIVSIYFIRSCSF